MFEVDRAIVEALFQKDLYYADLYDEVCEIRKRKVAEDAKIAQDVFSHALKRLGERNIIIKEVETEGRLRVKYKLSEKARKEYPFKILEFGSNKKIRQAYQKQIATNDPLFEGLKQKQKYQLLFFFGTSHRPIYKLSTEKALEEFLASIDISRDELQIVEDDVLRATITATTWPYSLVIPIGGGVSISPVTSITPPYAISITRYKTPVSELTLWKERYWQRTNSVDLKARKIMIELHRYIVTGIAVSDLLNQDRHMFQHINLGKEEVKKAFELLKEKGLIRPACEFQKEERYEIADEKLVKVIAACWEVFYTILEAFQLTWIYIRRRNDKEREWLSIFYGSKGAENIFRNCHYYRSNLSQDDKGENFQRKVGEEVGSLKRNAIDDIKEIKTKHAAAIEKYYFPLDSLISLIFPSWFQEEEDKESGNNKNVA